MSSFREADEVISDLHSLGFDYSKYRSEIEQFFETYLYHGNWDGSLDFSDQKSLRFIQEDEYDQHWTDDMPEEEYLTYSAGYYIWRV